MSVSHDHGYLAAAGGAAPSQAASGAAPRSRPITTIRNGMAILTRAPGNTFDRMVAAESAQLQQFTPQQYHQVRTPNQAYQLQQHQQQMNNHVHYTPTSQQQHHSLQFHPPQQQYGSIPGAGLNLAIPVRELTPEPIIKVEVKEEPVEEDPSTSEQYPEDDGDIDIQIRNVVCNYTLPLHIDLRKLALSSNNVTFDRGRGVLMKQKRNPGCYIKIYSSGKVYIVGCRSEADCMTAARSVARQVQRSMQKLNDVVKIRNYKVCNVLATCRMPFGIKIEELAQKWPAQSQYEPELSVGLVWRNVEPKATLRIHTTGSITVTGASSEAAVMQAIEIIYPIVKEFRCAMRLRGETKKKRAPRKRAAPTMTRARGPSAKRSAMQSTSGAIGNKVYFSDEDEDIYDEDDLLDDDE